jgi:hypothetical protein
MASPFPPVRRGAVEVLALATADPPGSLAHKMSEISPCPSSSSSRPEPATNLRLLEFEQFDRRIAGEQPSFTGRPNELSLGQFGQ